MLELLKRFRLDFHEVIVMTDTEKHPNPKKYVEETLTITFRITDIGIMLLENVTNKWYHIILSH